MGLVDTKRLRRRREPEVTSWSIKPEPHPPLWGLASFLSLLPSPPSLEYCALFPSQTLEIILDPLLVFPLPLPASRFHLHLPQLHLVSPSSPLPIHVSLPPDSLPGSQMPSSSTERFWNSTSSSIPLSATPFDQGITSQITTQSPSSNLTNLCLAAIPLNSPARRFTGATVSSDPTQLIPSPCEWSAATG